MAASITPGLTPQEATFLAENEVVEIIPRQKLDSLPLLGGFLPTLQPPGRAIVPLWLALLLKRQQRANIVSPSWLTIDCLTKILDFETELPTFTSSTPLPAASSQIAYPTTAVSPPFVESSTPKAPSNVFPYHWLEISQLILDGAGDDLEEADSVRRLVRDIRECRAAKMRKVVDELEGNRHVGLYGVSAMEVVEHRSFITGVIDGLRKIGASREASRKEREEEDRAAGRGRGAADDDSDDDMGL